jgi:hypothetical protein
VAAGGTVLALATVSTTAPTASLASSDVDPIFALIEEYRTAAKAVAAAADEDVLIEQGLGSGSFISVLDVSGPGAPVSGFGLQARIRRHSFHRIRFREVKAAAHAELDAKMERHNAIFGDSEDALNAAQDAETDAVEELVWTPPKTIAAVLALLELWPKLRRSRVLDGDQTDAITISVIDALRDIHPNA